MYQVYQTKAFILKSETQKEQDQKVLVFSFEFGLVWVNVSSSKKDGSKMRNFLQNFTFADLYLVVGKGGFRLTGGQFLENFYYAFKYNKEEKIRIVQNIFNLISKNLISQHPEKEIFSLFEKFVFEIKDLKDLKSVKEKELIFLANFLFQLGYFEEKYILKDNFSKQDFELLQKKVNEVFRNM
ncbi:hypothetical protein CSB11_01930 [Candidatus Campbellbacteria bacterium]|nr:MAG: hypothetical protein CSB11_01930 [Candidatus Campbellbacteria bacterium]